jgi:hypothetical protein
MKYKWDLEDFLEHCRKVARFHQGGEFDLADSDAEEEAAWQDTAIVEDRGLEVLFGGNWLFQAMGTADFG